ncbi:hypothetical protein [Acidocella sp. MX-AZ02]|uniref:hypothetical protein n=1 Tax=Acidocella sp. MX-AZ02 TaxID=1214225 RepID=UPI001969FC17|nr:hypothetical protein [Acidocella sp. MX-AZ02]
MRLLRSYRGWRAAGMARVDAARAAWFMAFRAGWWEIAVVDFGGIGGVPGGRPLNTDDDFEMAVSAVLGDQMRRDKTLCVEVWSALSNVDWCNDVGDTASYSFRAAGDMIAAIIGRGDYMDWYCSGPYGVVSERVEAALAQQGWRRMTAEERE